MSKTTQTNSKAAATKSNNKMTREEFLAALAERVSNGVIKGDEAPALIAAFDAAKGVL